MLTDHYERADIQVLEIRVDVTKDDRTTSGGTTRPDDTVEDREPAIGPMSMPKWKLLCIPFGVIPMRGSPKNPRTGCWRWNGLTGQP